MKHPCFNTVYAGMTVQSVTVTGLTITSISKDPQLLVLAAVSCFIIGILTARGQVLKILPHYPLDGQPATVEIHDMQGMVSTDEIVQELQGFPGPLVR
jgi:hypothetical protein